MTLSAITSGSTHSLRVVPVRVPSIGEKNQFANNLYSEYLILYIHTKKRANTKNYTNININVQYQQLPKFWAENNPRRVDMPIKSTVFFCRVSFKTY